MDDLISRHDVYDTLTDYYHHTTQTQHDALRDALSRVPSAQPESLTDKEQRIFLAAMGREEKVCKEVDRGYANEPHEVDSLMRVCREIKRKVIGALWT